MPRIATAVPTGGGMVGAVIDADELPDEGSITLWTEEERDKFERSVSAAECEACAKIVDEQSEMEDTWGYSERADVFRTVAAAIRARGTTS